MAVDTRNRRASVLGLGLAFRLALPAPDAAVDQPDRQHVAYSYAGLSAETLTTLNICDTSTASLNPVRTTALLNPVRSTAAYCEG